MLSRLTRRLLPRRPQINHAIRPPLCAPNAPGCSSAPGLYRAPYLHSPQRAATFAPPNPAAANIAAATVNAKRLRLARMMLLPSHTRRYDADHAGRALASARRSGQLIIIARPGRVYDTYSARSAFAFRCCRTSRRLMALIYAWAEASITSVLAAFPHASMPSLATRTVASPIASLPTLMLRI